MPSGFSGCLQSSGRRCEGDALRATSCGYQHNLDFFINLSFRIHSFNWQHVAESNYASDACVYTLMGQPAGGADGTPSARWNARQMEHRQYQSVIIIFFANRHKM